MKIFRESTILFVLLLVANLCCPSCLEAQEPVHSDYSAMGPEDSVLTFAEVMPRFPGGDDARIEFVKANLIYPDSALKAGIQGTVYVSFIVGKDGKLSNFNVSRGLGHGCDSEVIRMISSMPAWEPGMNQGKLVPVRYTLPVKFKLVNPDVVYTVVEQMPEFPGGEVARLEFFWSNIKMPEEAKEKGVNGRVYVSFIVRPDGKITDISIVKGLGWGCDEEVLRVVKMMPDWIPARQSGKPVSVQFTMPVGFATN